MKIERSASVLFTVPVTTAQEHVNLCLNTLLFLLIIKISVILCTNLLTYIADIQKLGEVNLNEIPLCQRQNVFAQCLSVVHERSHVLA